MITLILTLRALVSLMPRLPTGKALRLGLVAVAGEMALLPALVAGLAHGLGWAIHGAVTRLATGVASASAASSSAEASTLSVGTLAALVS